MEPNDDPELHSLLREWKAPLAPPSLAARVLERRRWTLASFFRKSIRVPVPVACCVLALLGLLAWHSFERSSVVEQAAHPSLTFRELRPVAELRPRIIRGPHGREN